MIAQRRRGAEKNTEKDYRLVECPLKDGVFYFRWVCLENKQAGKDPCTRCMAPNFARSLQEIMDGFAAAE